MAGVSGRTDPASAIATANTTATEISAFRTVM